MKLISMIVPIYNAEKWLYACLSSLLEQDLSTGEYEIICVDDGSTDGSADIVTGFQKKYSNINLLRKSNSGVSDARNMGMDHACGKYIWFVDSDDLIRRNCLGFLKQIIEKHDPETISFGVEFVPEAFEQKEEASAVYEYTVDESLKSYNNVWNSLICTELIRNHNIRFSSGLKFGEDTLFQYAVYMYRQGSRPSLSVKNPLYFYRQQNASAMHHRSEGAYDKHVQDLIEMARIYHRDYDNKIVDNQKKLREVKMRQCMAVEGALALLPKSRYRCNDILNTLTEEGLYPYPLMWWKVKRAKGLKAKAISFIRMLFAIKFFYKIYYGVLAARRA